MSRTARLLVVVVAWLLPAAWVSVALLSSPTDGTSLTSSLVSPAGQRWGESVTVVRTFGETPLREGDEVVTMRHHDAGEGVPVGDWVRSGGDAGLGVGDVLVYEVQRGTGLGLDQEIEVTLSRYPLAAALRAEPVATGLAVALLLVGSAVFWARPTSLSARAFLAATALLPAALTSFPWGTSAVDLTTPRGVAPQAVGEWLAALGLVALIVSVASLVGTRWRGGSRLLVVLACLAPAAGYALWLALELGSVTAGPARLQVLASVAVPALCASVPALLATAWLAHGRAPDREGLLATRLVLFGVGSAVVVWGLLGPVAQWLTGERLVPWDVLAVVTVGVALACCAVAAAHFRLDDIEPPVRRGLVQALVLVVVGVVFVGLVGALDLAADVSVGSVVVGGLVALLLLPVAVAVQRLVRRWVYGDREFPHRVVSDLRRLDPVDAPEEPLREVLELLARRLHLSFAAVDVRGTGSSEVWATSIGAPRGTPVTVDLAVGGNDLGTLRLEVDADHDPFGPGDRRLLEDVGSQVGALVQAVVANRELQQARQRLVAAREEERRRLRRDLHDGLGPSLATLAMRLEGAADLVHEDPAQAAELLARLSEGAREDIAEVRRLVEGLRPPALDQLGLVSALRQRAAEHASGDARLPVPWTVEATGDLDPLPAAVEVAAYRIVVEAVNNVQRHSRADRCTVRLTREGGDLAVRITDTGQGLAADHRAGVGLSSMRERAEELGGSFEVVPGSGAGTTVQVLLPLHGTEDGPSDPSGKG